MTETRLLRLRYYAFRASNSAGFYLPISIVFLQQQGFGLAFIGATQAVFGLASLLAEVPSGYLGDRVGRRGSLAVGTVFRASAMLSYPFLDAKVAFLAVQAVWATGFAFRSGTQDAWLYELLRTQCASEEYARVEGRGSTVLLAVSAGGALASGLLFGVWEGLPFLVNAAVALSGLALLATFPAVSEIDGRAPCSVDRPDHLDPTALDNSEVHVGGAVSTTRHSDDETTADFDDETGVALDDETAEESDSEEPFGLGDALRVLRLQTTRPSVRWLVVYAALFGGLFSLTRWLEQPMLREVGVPVAGLGVVYAALKLVSAGAAATAGWFEERVGVAGVFLLLVPVYGLAYGSVAVTSLAVVPALFLNRSVQTVVRPVRNQYLNDRLDDVGRATVLSGVSMVVSLAGVAANLSGGRLAQTVGPLRLLPWVGVGVAVVAAVLWVLTSPVRAREGTASHADRLLADVSLSDD